MNYGFLLLLLCSSLVRAEIEYRDFKQPEQEQVYQTLINQLRCLVCQNQTIADSNADLAKDLRRQVYEMLQQGQTEAQIVDFMLQRYGDFVLYKPLVNLKTGLLWFGPVLFMLIGLISVWLFARRKPNQTGSGFTKQEQQHIEQLLEPGDDSE